MAVQPAAALKTAVRIPQGEYEEEMRLQSAGGAGGGGHCCRCAVSGALFLLRAMISEKLRGRDTAPIHRRYRWWRGMLKGAVAGTSPTGPWTDGRTGVQTPDDDERHPWRIPLDRPCLLCYLVQKRFKPDWGGGVQNSQDFKNIESGSLP